MSTSPFSSTPRPRWSSASALTLVVLLSSGCDGSGPSEPDGSRTVASITLAPEVASVARGETGQLTATVRNAAGGTVSDVALQWVSENPAIATVDSTGVVTGVSTGVTQVRASAGDVTGEAMVQVEPPEAAWVEVSPSFAALAVGEARPFRAMAFSAGGDSIPEATVTWTAAGGVVEVSGNGTATVTGGGGGWLVAQAGAAVDSARVVGLGSGSLLATAMPEAGHRFRAPPGQEVRVEVAIDLSRVSPDRSLGALMLEVAFDPQVLDFTGSEVTAEGLGVAHLVEPGTVRFAFAAGSPQGDPIPVPLALTFRVVPGAAVGSESSLGLRILDTFSDLTGAPFPAPVVEGGSVRVVAP